MMGLLIFLGVNILEVELLKEMWITLSFYYRMQKFSLKYRFMQELSFCLDIRR